MFIRRGIYNDWKLAVVNQINKDDRMVKMKSTEELADERWRERTSSEDGRILSAIGAVVVLICVVILITHVRV